MNERLNNAGLLDDFFKAANKKDRERMVALLVSIELERSQAEEFTESILSNPAFKDF